MLKSAILILTLLQATSAQDTKKNSRPLVSSRAPAVYSQVSFDVSIRQLPAHFKGHDIALLYKAFEKMGTTEKSEYETTEHFNRRLSALRTKPVAGSITTRSTLAFVRSDLDSVYDADVHLLEISLPVSEGSSTATSGDLGDHRTLPSIVVKSTSTTRLYIGSNAFGASARIEDIADTKFKVAFTNDEFPIQKGGYADAAIPIELKMNADDARHLKKAMSALIICSMNDEPRTFERNRIAHTATLEFPFDQSYSDYGLNTRLLAVWFFDSSSGKVYAKIEPKTAVELSEGGPKIQPLAMARGSRDAEWEKAPPAVYLAKAAAEPGAVKSESGLVYREVRPGTGESPKATDTVKVNYRGTLVNGTEFDSSYKRNEPAQFPLNGVIKCWTEGVQKMKTGGKSMLICPSDLAYGDHGAPSIPGGATLIFEIELLEIVAAGK
jgi:FKBP-type peptidyl-prolyl cis-trans isomerase